MLCTICFELIEDKVHTNCNHEFCRTCLAKWIETDNHCHNNCPLCRTPLIPLWRQWPRLFTRTITRKVSARERTLCLVHKWQSYEINHTFDEMYKIAFKISNEHILFTSDPMLKILFNTIVTQAWNNSGEDRFMLLLKV